ncbi:response regulator [Actinoplanes sp. NEAU-A12]|uniref:Response regulator n=1 Tax=Actinoplanes sandaracinus TaxID=3045177 RepID=A0ABT6WX71_9ACTN|nr:response regulator [Actinoplanes sandaracinus]MDI6104342.1 response regulator [Actinoplanes sandaracinus]
MDDDDDVRAVVVRILHRAGHTVVPAADGAAGLQAVRDHLPDLVVSDIDMPVMSGSDLCCALREDPGHSDLPVLFISGSLVPGDTRPIGAQATAVLRKPFTSAELLACVEKLLQGGHRPGQEPSTCP